MDRLSALLLTLMTGVLGVATALMAITVPSLWSMSGDLGAIKARVEILDKRTESFDGKLDGLGRRLDGLDARLAHRETDASNLVAQAGLRPDSEFGGVRIGQKLFVLPKSDKAQAELARAGIPREAITPSTFGYVLGTFDGAGRLVPSGLSPASLDAAPSRN